MTVASQTPSITYAAAGVATVFAFPFRLLAASDLAVTLNGVAATGYTVSLGDLTGGSITFALAPTGTLVIRRAMPLMRAANYLTLGDFSAANVNEDFDRLEMQLQEVGAVGNLRALRVPAGESVADFPAAAGRANGIAAFDSVGNPIVVPGQAGSASTLAIDLASTSLLSKGAGQIGYNKSLLYSAGSVGRKLAESRSVRDYGAVGDGVTNDAAAFQLAHDTLGPLGITDCYVPPGVYLIGTQVNINLYAIDFRGAGCSMGAAIGQGTWLKITSSAISPFVISNGGETRGTAFRRMGIAQTHAAPGGGWTPTNYPAVFTCSTTSGEFTLEDIFCVPVNKLVVSTLSGRLNLRRILGQFFGPIANIDTAYDAPRIVGIHAWPYWSADANVLSYQQANTDGFLLGRVDTPFMDEVFVYASRSVIHTVTTGGGNTSLVNFGRLIGDSCKYGLWIESANLTGNIGSLVHQCEVAPQGTGVPIVGGYAVYQVGNSARYQISALHTERHRKEAIRVDGTACDIRIGVADMEFFNYDNDGSGAINVTQVSSIVIFASPPKLLNGNGNKLAASTGVTQSLLSNEVANAVNSMRGASAATGGSPSLFATGSDTNIGASLFSKGTGRASLGADFVPVISADVGASGNTNVLVRSNPGELQVILESAAANADMTLIPKGTGAVRFGTYAASGLAVTGYITVKDAGGTTRRLLVG